MNKFILLSTLVLLSLASCRTYDGLVDDISALDIPATLPSLESTPDNLAYDAFCPLVEVVEALKYYDDFNNDTAPSESGLVSRATIANVNNSCTQNVRTVTTDVKIQFQGNLGPNGRFHSSDKPFFSYPFFVAITAPNGQVLSKEVFAASLTYPPDASQQSYHENLRFIMPLEKSSQGKRQKILIGFQLNPDQLTYNRKRIEAEKKRLEQERKREESRKKAENKSRIETLKLDPGQQ